MLYLIISLLSFNIIVFTCTCNWLRIYFK